MTKTEYLFGFPKEKYGEGLVVIAEQRIKDARALLAELYPKVSYDPKNQNEEQVELTIRMRKVLEAITTWEKILEIEEV